MTNPTIVTENPETNYVPGQPIPVPQSAMPPKSRWQRVKDWLSARPQVAKGTAKDFWNGPYEEFHSDVPEETRGLSKAGMLAAAALAIGGLWYVTANMVGREYPASQIDGRRLDRTGIYETEDGYAIKYFNHGKRPDKELTSDDEDSLSEAVKHAEMHADAQFAANGNKGDRMWFQQMYLDDIAGSDNHISKDEFTAASKDNVPAIYKRKE